jgi:hypothetical protein
VWVILWPIVTGSNPVLDRQRDRPLFGVFVSTPEQMTSIDGKSIAQNIFSTVQVFPKVVCDIVTQYAERLYFKLDDRGTGGYLAHSERFLFQSSGQGRITVYSSKLNWQVIKVMQFSGLTVLCGMSLYKYHLIVVDNFSGELTTVDTQDDNPDNWLRYPSSLFENHHPLLRPHPTDCHVNGDILSVCDNSQNTVYIFEITFHENTNVLKFSFLSRISSGENFNEQVFLPTTVRTVLMPNGSIRGFIGQSRNTQVFEQKYGLAEQKREVLAAHSFSQALKDYQYVYLMALWKNLLFMADDNTINVIDVLTFEYKETWVGTLNGLSWGTINGIDVTDDFLCISDNMMKCVHLIPHSLSD